MLVKVHNSPNGSIIAICDKELLDKVFSEAELQLDLTSSFYKGEEKSEEKVISLCKKAYLVNLVGDKAIRFALKNNLIDKNKIMKIQEIPVCQTIVIRE